MSAEPDLQTLWQSQPVAPQELDMVDLQAKSDAFAKVIAACAAPRQSEGGETWISERISARKSTISSRNQRRMSSAT